MCGTFCWIEPRKIPGLRNSVSRFVLAHHYILTIVIIHECVYNLTYSRCGLWFGVLNFLRRWGQGRGNIFDSLTPSEVPEGSSGDVRASHSTSCAGGESSFLQLRFEWRCLLSWTFRFTRVEGTVVHVLLYALLRHNRCNIRARSYPIAECGVTSPLNSSIALYALVWYAYY